MKTQEFLSLLKENQNKKILFEYKKGSLVGANYHITEIKNIIIDAVDCGAGTDYWKETIVQLWESPTEKDTAEYMSGFKALDILNKVDHIKPMEKNAEIKFEYSNANFHTAQLHVLSHQKNEQFLLFNLSVQQTDCKAKDACGIPVETENDSNTSCTPGSGCC